MRRADLISAGVLVALGLIALLYVIPNFVTVGGGSDDLSPAFMPYVAAALATVSMLALLGSRWLRTSTSHEAAPFTRASAAFIAIAIVVLLATFVLLEEVGYRAGAACIVAGFMAMARAGWRATVAAAIVFPLALWGLFDRLLDFPLP
jgi:hypothetical protein